MARNSVSRGRPKGSGVNDAARIAAIAELIAAHPGMKPTTAIKQLGVTDASVIRRLRDKYNLQAESRSEAIESAKERPRVAAAAHKASSYDIRTETPARRAARTPAKPRPERKQASESASDVHRAPPSVSPRPDLFSALFAAGVSAAQVAIQLQFKSMSLAFDGSPLACYLRGQEFMRLMTANLAVSSPETRCSRP